MPVTDDLGQLELAHIEPTVDLVRAADMGDITATINGSFGPETSNDGTFMNDVADTIFMILQPDGWFDSAKGYTYRLNIKSEDETLRDHWARNIAIYRDGELQLLCIWNPINNTYRVATTFGDRLTGPEDVRDYREIDFRSGEVRLEQHVYKRSESMGHVTHERIDQWDPELHQRDKTWKPDLERPDRRIDVTNNYHHASNKIVTREEIAICYEYAAKKPFPISTSKRFIRYDEQEREIEVNEHYLDHDSNELGTRSTVTDYDAGTSVMTERLYRDGESGSGNIVRTLTKQRLENGNRVVEQRTRYLPVTGDTPRAAQRQGPRESCMTVEVIRRTLPSGDVIEAAQRERVSIDGIIVTYDTTGNPANRYRLISSWEHTGDALRCTSAIWQNIANPRDTFPHPAAELTTLIPPGTDPNAEINRDERPTTLRIVETPPFEPQVWDQLAESETHFTRPDGSRPLEAWEFEAHHLHPRVAAFLEQELPTGEPIAVVVRKGGIIIIPQERQTTGSVETVYVLDGHQRIVWVCRPGATPGSYRIASQYDGEDIAHAGRLEDWVTVPGQDELFRSEWRSLRWENVNVRPTSGNSYRRADLTRAEQWSWDPQHANEPGWVEDLPTADLYVRVDRENFYDDGLPREQTESYRYHDSFVTRTTKRKRDGLGKDTITCTEVLADAELKGNVLIERNTTTELEAATNSQITQHETTLFHQASGNIEVERTTTNNATGTTTIEERREYVPAGTKQGVQHHTRTMRIETRTEAGTIVSRSGTLDVFDQNHNPIDVYTMTRVSSGGGQHIDVWQDRHGHIVEPELEPAAAA
jgi:hypothetical protein